MKIWPPRKAGWVTLWYLDLVDLPQAQYPADITFRLAESAESGELANAMGEPTDREPRHRFALQRDAYVGVRGERIVTFCWVTYDRELIGEIEWHLTLKPGEAYIWDCVTRQTDRGRGLYPALLTFILHDLQRRGYHRAWIGTTADNTASIRGLTKAGFYKVADLRYRRLLWQRRLDITETANCPPELAPAIRAAFADP